MREYVLESVQELRAPLARIFAFFSDAGNLETITPPWLNFRMLTPRPIEMRAGALIDYRVKVRGISIRWRSLISVWEPPFRFVDEQVRGPYRQWIHEHRFEPVRDGVRCTDHVRYIVPGGPLAPLIHRQMVRPDLDRIFSYRRDVLPSLIEAGSDADRGAQVERGAHVERGTHVA